MSSFDPSHCAVCSWLQGQDLATDTTAEVVIEHKHPKIVLDINLPEVSYEYSIERNSNLEK